MTSSISDRRLIVFMASIPVFIGELNGLYNPALFRASSYLFWLIDLASFVLVPGILAYWLAKSANIRPKQYGLECPPKQLGELLGSSLFLGALLFCLYFVPHRLVWAYTGYPALDFSYAATAPSGFFRLPVVLYLSFSAGLMESVFFLGLPWFLWRQYFNPAQHRTLFAWLSSAVFASVHWEQGLHGLIASFAFGYAACIFYWKLNNLWPIVGAHTVVDIVEFF